MSEIVVALTRLWRWLMPEKVLRCGQHGSRVHFIETTRGHYVRVDSERALDWARKDGLADVGIVIAYRLQDGWSAHKTHEKMAVIVDAGAQ